MELTIDFLPSKPWHFFVLAIFFSGILNLIFRKKLVSLLVPSISILLFILADSLFISADDLDRDPLWFFAAGLFTFVTLCGSLVGAFFVSKLQSIRKTNG